jgi:hypothetical protein
MLDLPSSSPFTQSLYLATFAFHSPYDRSRSSGLDTCFAFLFPALY